MCWAKHSPTASRRGAMNFRVALLQIAPAGADQSNNLQRGLQACREAKALGSDLAVFPELWNVGCSLQNLGRQHWIDAAIDRQSSFVQAFASLARELEMNIALTYLEAHQPLPRNTVSVLDGHGDVALNYSKVFLCDFGTQALQRPNLRQDEIGC